MDAWTQISRRAIMFVIFCIIYLLFFRGLPKMPGPIPIGDLLKFFTRFAILAGVVAGAFIFGYACISAALICFVPFVFFPDQALARRIASQSVA